MSFYKKVRSLSALHAQFGYARKFINLHVYFMIEGILRAMSLHSGVIFL
jgi:hypothetical protein